MFKVAILAVIHMCSQAVRRHRCFRIRLQKSWENNIFSQFSLLSIFNYGNGWAFKYRKKCQNLTALAGIPVHFCKPDRTHLLQLFHTYLKSRKKPNWPSIFVHKRTLSVLGNRNFTDPMSSSL